MNARALTDKVLHECFAEPQQEAVFRGCAKKCSLSGVEKKRSAREEVEEAVRILEREMPKSRALLKLREVLASKL
jgi:hypothetical protein